MNNKKELQEEIKDDEMIKPDKEKFSIDFDLRRLAIGLILVGIVLIGYAYLFSDEMNTNTKGIVIDSIEYDFEENKLYLYSDNNTYYIKYNMYNKIFPLDLLNKKVIILYNKFTNEIYNLKYEGD